MLEENVVLLRTLALSARWPQRELKVVPEAQAGHLTEGVKGLFQLVLADVLADPPPRRGLHNWEMRAVEMNIARLPRDKPPSSGADCGKLYQFFRRNVCHHINNLAEKGGQRIRGENNFEKLRGVLSTFRCGDIAWLPNRQNLVRSQSALNAFSKCRCDVVIECGPHREQRFNDGDRQRY